MGSDADDLELTRRRLEEQVKSKVEADLFRYYRNLGAAILTALGLVGVTVGWPAIQSLIKEQIATQVSGPVKESRKAADEAEKVANQTLDRLEAKQTSLNEAIGRTSGRYENITIQFGEISEKQESLIEDFEEKAQFVEFFKTQVQANPVTREDLQLLEARMTAIIDQTTALASAVKSLEASSSYADEIESAEQGLKAIADEQTSEQMQAQAVKVSQPRTGLTAYVQFAGGNREDIKIISANLRDRGWLIPGEERVKSAVGKKFVRYYHIEDKPAAELLAKDVNEAVSQAGFKPVDVKAETEPFTGVKMPPALGVLELWLEIS